MSSHVMPSSPIPACAQVTSTWVTRAVFGLILGCVAWRVPQTYRDLDSSLPDDLAAQIPDPGVRALALRAGVLLGVLVVALAMALVLAICRWLERRLFPVTRSLKSARIGLFTMIVAVLVPPITLSGTGTLLRSTPSAQLLAVGVALAVVGLGFGRGLGELPRGRAGAVIVVGALLALSLTAN